METVVGIFKSRDDARIAIKQLRSLGVPDRRLVLLTPGTDAAELETEIRTIDAEAPGIGQALGATVGGAMGVAGGYSLGAAAASLVLPGVGPIIAAGILSAAILGLGGAATGAAVGESMEENIDVGLPHDEVFIYEDALRKGRTVVLGFVDDDEKAERARELLAQAGAESIDSAREEWWVGLRDAEEEQYQVQGRVFKTDEVSYRRGFEAALNRQFRGKSLADAAVALDQKFAGATSDEAFRRGYESGLSFQKRLEAERSN